MRGLKIGIIILLCLAGVTVCSVVGKGCGLASHMVNDGIQTAKDEFSPSVLLKKYEMFKNMHAALSAKKAQIDNYKNEIDAFKEDYVDDEGTFKISLAPRDERESYRMTRTTVRGLISKFNTMAAEYNAAMVKFNYRFCNAGELPQGATEPLPREYITYATN